MASMEKGFYTLTLSPYIYYGLYPKEQVSGQIKLSVVRPEHFKTDKPFSAEDFAVKLYDNHALTEQELEDMKQAFKKIMTVLNIHEMQEVDFAKTEERLGITLPQEIKTLYTMLCQVDSMMSGAERFLPLDEIYLDGENLVFYKVKRTPTAFSLKDGILMRYHKKEWNYSLGDESFLCFVLNRMVVKAITEMPVNKKGKIKGELRKVLSPQEPLQQMLKGKLDILEEYRNYGNIVLFNKMGALGWFRQNGFYADILVGCVNNEILEEIMATELEVVWE